MARRKKRKSTFLILLLVLLLGTAGGAWWISPTKDLDLGYRPLDVKDKVLRMVETREPRMFLNADEVAQLSKKNLITYLNTHHVGVDVTGAEFRMQGKQMIADINGKWGVLPFGAQLEFQMKSSGSHIVLGHTSTSVRGWEVPQGLFHLQPITISLKDYLPDMLTVKNIEFLAEGLQLSFTIDWMNIPSLF
ncbi:hypothetical protein [Paenibacillus lemnae]|uniref:DUF2140 family protein n=1 Tax=Paenibacillus lemnae TaxID=1330551 RepID=A0A848M9C0_PAELE|nr:hypothetical protein [Paenibacillus lemnae]NMO97275.1 hypothetical protein [Paenibacillus lemnae]